MRRFNLLVDGKGGFTVSHCLRSVFQLAESESLIPERGSFANEVAGLACDLEDLLIELDGAAGLSQGGVGHAQVAERGSFRVTPAHAPGGGEHRLEPLNDFVRMLPQIEHVGAFIGICDAELSHRFVTAGLLYGPGMSGFDIRALQIEEPQTAQDLIAATKVESIGGRERFLIMPRVQPPAAFSKRTEINAFRIW